jgi:hypothetical protein
MTGNTKRLITLSVVLLVSFGATVSGLAQGTAFTYQGRLTENGALANGAYDFQFNIFAANSGGSPLASTFSVNDLPVVEGMFTALLDFGSSVFNGADRFLEISVRAGNSSGQFRIVSPRQRVTPTPYAMVAGNVNGSGSINASQLTAGTVPNSALGNAWKTTGNSGTSAGANFVGTTDNQPLELRANDHRALRIEPNTNGAPNMIGGAPVNFVFPEVVGATIGGGGAAAYFGAVLSNSVNRDFGAIGGGINNTIDGGLGTIAGGENNFIGAKGVWGAIGGGFQNTNTGPFSTVPGGRDNRAQGNTSLAAGNRAKANHNGTFVWADSQFADFASTTTDQFLIRAANGVGIGTTNPAARLTIGGFGAFDEKSAAAIVLTNTTADTGRGWEWHALDDGRMQFADYTARRSRMIIDTNGNVGIGVNPSSKLHVAGDVRIGTFPIVAQSGIAPTANSTVTPGTGYVVLTPTANVTLSVTTAIANGTAAGQVLMLQGDGSFAVTIPDNANTRMSGAVVLANNDVLTLIWNGADWVQVSFSDN